MRDTGRGCRSECNVAFGLSQDSNEPRCEKTDFFICKNKDADQLRGRSASRLPRS